MADYSALWVGGAIVTSDLRRFPFWTNAGSGLSDRESGAAQTGAPQGLEPPSALDPTLESLAWIQEVSVEINLGEVPKISINLSPPFEDARKFLNSPLIRWGESTIEVQFGYLGGGEGEAGNELSPVFSGVMMQPDVTIGVDVSITINATGISSWALDRATGGRVARPGETREQLIDRILKGPGGVRDLKAVYLSRPPLLSLPIVASPSTLAEAGAQAFSEPKGGWAQGGKSDWLAIWELSNLMGLRYVLDGNLVVFSPRTDDYNRSPSRVFKLYDYRDGRLGAGVDDNAGKMLASGTEDVFTYPIMEFSSPTQAVYLPASCRGYVMGEISDTEPRKASVPTVVDRKTVPGVATSENAGEPPVSSTNPAPEEGTKDGPPRLPGDPEHPEDLEAARKEFEKDNPMGIEIEIETIGVPKLQPGEAILVEGLGRIYALDRWNVFTVRHQIGLGGFSTNFTAVSNTDAFFAEAGERGAYTANTKTMIDPAYLSDLDSALKGTTETTQAGPLNIEDQEPFGRSGSE